MKKIICIILGISMLLSVFTPVLAYEYDHENEYGYDFCTYYEEGEHDFSCGSSKEKMHPHKGYFECECGKRMYFEKGIMDDCYECKEYLCDIGIHNYTHFARYTSYDSGIAECMCGDYVEFYYDDEYYNEEDLFITKFYKKTLIIEKRHPHEGLKEYDNGKTESVDSYYIGDCPVCQLEDDYYDEVEQFEMDYVLRNTTETPKKQNQYREREWEQEEESYYWDEIDFGLGIDDYEDKYTITMVFDDYISVIEKRHPHQSYVQYESGATQNTGFSKFGQCPMCQEEEQKEKEEYYETYIYPQEQQYQQGSVEKEKKKETTISFSSSSSITTNISINGENYHYENYYETTDPNSSYSLEQNVTVEYEQECQQAVPQQNYVPQNNPSNTSSNNNSSSNKEPVFYDGPYIIIDNNYIQDEFDKLPKATNSTLDFNAIVDQTLMGNYAEKVTLGGTIGELVLSLAGVDVWKDVTDLWYDITHFKNDFSHWSTTALDAIALFPIIGAAKNTDEVALVKKTADKYTTLSKFLKNISKADVKKLATFGDAHALTKHAGNTSQSVLKLMRNGSKNISSFTDEATALDCIKKALQDKGNISKISNAISSGKKKFTVDINMGRNIGKGMFNGKDTVESAQKARIVLKVTENDDFYVLTAYPIK